MDDLDIVDGNAIFEWVASNKVNKETEESYEVIKTYIRSHLHLGDMDSSWDAQDFEQCVVILNLLNAVRWFQKTIDEVE